MFYAFNHGCYAISNNFGLYLGSFYNINYKKSFKSYDILSFSGN